LKCRSRAARRAGSKRPPLVVHYSAAESCECRRPLAPKMCSN
jgi:hypothetical protein